MDRFVHRSLQLIAILFLLVALPAQARIEPPDHVYYGTASLYGVPVAPGAVVEARSVPDDALLKRYLIGSNTQLGGWYKLAIPLDTVDPRKPGRARVGDPIRIFVNGQLAGQVSVGIDPGGAVRGVGSTTRLDLDPQSMGTGPAISIHDTEVVEGDQGVAVASVQVTLNAVDEERTIGIQWETRDGTATGGAGCGPGIDFVQRSGETLVIEPGEDTGRIDIDVCGDTDVETDEAFTVVLLSTTDNHGVIQDSTATVTIRDDDDVPTLQVPDIRVARSSTSTTIARFTATLSRSHRHDVSFRWRTQNLTAVAGVDYDAVDANVTIPSGEMEAVLDVPVHPSASITPERRFRIAFSEAVSLRLPTAPVVATIIDPRQDPSVVQDDAVTGAQIEDLKQPTGIRLSPDGRHAYVTSANRKAVLHFERDTTTGALSNPVSYKTDSAGFSGARLKGAQDLELSPDGAYLYVVAMDDDAVTVLARDGVDGSLSFVQSLVNGESLSGMKKPFRLALDPAGAHVYVLARESNAVVALARDAGTGQLGFASSVAQAAGGLQKLDRPNGIAVSPGGAQVLVTADSNALLVFDRERDPASAEFGKLSLRHTLDNGPGGIAAGLGGAFGIALSPDGRSVYVAARADKAVSWFTRASNGGLSFGGVIRRDVLEGVPGLDDAYGVAVTPDGQEVFVTGHDDSSMSVFSRVGDGSLAIRQTVFGGDDGNQHLIQPGAIVASGDNRFVYVAANGGDSAIVIYRRLGLENDLFSDDFEPRIAVP